VCVVSKLRRSHLGSVLYRDSIKVQSWDVVTRARESKIHTSEQNCTASQILLRGLQIDQALAYSPFQCKSTIVVKVIRNTATLNAMNNTILYC